MAPHRRTRRSTRPLWFAAVAAVVVGLVLVGLRLVPGSPLATSAPAPLPGSGNAAAGPSPSVASPRVAPTPALPPLAVRPAKVTVDTDAWYGWSMIDLRTGKISGSANMTQTSTTASLIKAWIVADYLRRTAEAGETPSETRLAELTKIIRDSDNTLAERLYTRIGRAESIDRLLSICKLTDSSVSESGGWSRTHLSPRDDARLGACIADGRAAGPQWTDWLLKEMRLVRGVGNFGIRKAFPLEEQKSIAIKNGWVDRTAEQEYHVSCLAIGDGWAIGVMTRYPIERGYPYGAKICQSVGEQLRNPL
ncbi:MAG TPA: hypothetical protein VHN18_00195 [Micromonosporaceae bacterium]|nr:hypothetical protein [Micromonosporaceae bacterium]